MSIKSRVGNIAFALDCFLFSVATFGSSYPNESFSSAAWRSELYGKPYGKVRPLIDFITGTPNHCQLAYENAYRNLPPDELLKAVTM